MAGCTKARKYSCADGSHLKNFTCLLQYSVIASNHAPEQTAQANVLVHLNGMQTFTIVAITAYQSGCQSTPYYGRSGNDVTGGFEREV